MPNLRRFLTRSQHPVARLGKRVYHGLLTFTLPAPRVVVLPMLWVYLGTRSVYYYLMRVLVCEPLFKAYCRSYGRGVRTGVYVHWVQGKGDLIVGDFVTVDGKCSFHFASRFIDRPTLLIGNGTGIGHNCSFTIGRRIEIGRHCRVGVRVTCFDSSGHPTDPGRRLSNEPPAFDEVRPITIGDNVWIASDVIILPGVNIGEGSVVSAGSVVMSDVPPNTIVAGNPARRVMSLAPAPPTRNYPART